MSTRAPRSYDEITRATVPEPDSSWRPSEEQEKRAKEGFRALDVDEQKLSEAVHDALLEAGMDSSTLHIEVDRDRVILRGQVRDRESMMKIPAIVGQVDGVRAVVDQLVIAK
jgi:osmotically-inducible protein OsmY